MIQDSAKNAAQSLIYAIENSNMMDWENFEVKQRCQQAIESLGGRGYLVHNMTPGAAAVYLCALIAVNS